MHTSRSSGRRARPRFSLTRVAVVVLMLGAAGTAGLYVLMRHYEAGQAQLDFNRRADAHIDDVQAGLRDAIDSVSTVNRLFSAVAPLSREQFHRFAEPLVERHPFVQAYEFHRRLTRAERPAFEARMQRDFPGYAILQMHGEQMVPAAEQDDYNVVDYIEPMAGNEIAFGLEVSLNRHMSDVLGRAIDNGGPAATRLLKLAQGGTQREGFLIMQPVYRSGMPLDTPAARRAALVGDTAAVIRVHDLVARLFANDKDAGLEMRVYADADSGNGTLVYRHGRSGGDESAPVHALLHEHLVPRTRNIDVAGVPWRVEMAATPVPLSLASSSTLLLAFGILTTILWAAYLQVLAQRARAVQALVRERTAELSAANEQLRADIVERELADHQLRLRERVIESSANAILIVRAEAPDFPIEYVNPAFERITGYSGREMLGQHFRVLKTDQRDRASFEEIKSALAEQRETHVTIRALRKDGSMYWNDVYLAPVRDRSGVVSHFVMTQYDVTSTKYYEAELEYQANRDSLTGLANRNLLMDRLRQALTYADRFEHSVWLAFVDLDRFKVVNESLGHRAGDHLLKQVAQRLVGALREADTIARTGGDEFILVLPQGGATPLTAAAIRKVVEVLSTPFMVEGHELFVSASIGVAIYPDDGTDADALIKHAEIAMYRAKESGRNTFQFYAPAMNQEALERLHLEANLRSAIERNELVLHYQPQVDASDRRIVGAEALLRWQHPELGMVPPGRFISLAEDTGLIVPIGAWVLRTACRQAAAWNIERAAGERTPLRVAVNMSARQFYQQDMVETVAAILDETGLPAGCLEIELTESLVMTDVESAIHVLGALKRLGVHIAIDDFGTGYSSLSYLKRFPIDVLKIDQSFVRDINEDADDAAIVASIISLARSLRLRVVAEGVETPAQLAFLQAHGCAQAQGYLFARPLPVAEIERLLALGEPLAADAAEETARILAQAASPLA